MNKEGHRFDVVTNVGFLWKLHNMGGCKLQKYRKEYVKTNIFVSNFNKGKYIGENGTEKKKGVLGEPLSRWDSFM